MCSACTEACAGATVVIDSVVVYDPRTRSELQTTQPDPSRNSKRDDLSFDDDGSITLTIAPEPPERNEETWIQTVAGKDWFAILRLYGPLDPWFEQTWIPGDIEPHTTPD